MKNKYITTILLCIMIGSFITIYYNSKGISNDSDEYLEVIYDRIIVSMPFNVLVGVLPLENYKLIINMIQFEYDFMSGSNVNQMTISIIAKSDSIDIGGKTITIELFREIDSEYSFICSIDVEIGDYNGLLQINSLIEVFIPIMLIFIILGILMSILRQIIPRLPITGKIINNTKRSTRHTKNMRIVPDMPKTIAITPKIEGNRVEKIEKTISYSTLSDFKPIKLKKEGINILDSIDRIYCSTCGTELKPKEIFCIECGNKVI